MNTNVRQNGSFLLPRTSAWSSPSEESDESPLKGTDRIWLALYNKQDFSLITRSRKPNGQTSKREAKIAW